MAKLKRNIKVTSEITLSSMSDIAFLLIIFFLVTSIFLMKDGLHVSMPDRNKPPVFISADKILTIEYRKDGILYLKDKKAEMAEIKEELSKWNIDNSGEAVLLKISGELPYEKAVTLIDTVKASGETKFSVRMI
ncbi:MAG TPA: biopolymer transporter ExbD [Spirochaetota bacterium]|nr:biopolymer transporter ExbD [Spirochaetota bacterium]HPF05931.1 biopolymer transporter ExbD [Spirochaetota bacterium]HPR39041.1 biopolymer transporter ExbD [Spirochaetota bacterium]